jgi:hypothetical protein
MLGLQTISKACREKHSKQLNKTSEGEEAMVLTTSWKEEGHAEGLAEGRQEAGTLRLCVQSNSLSSAERIGASRYGKGVVDSKFP